MYVCKPNRRQSLLESFIEKHYMTCMWVLWFNVLTLMYPIPYQVLDTLSSLSQLVHWHQQLTQTVNEVPNMAWTKKEKRKEKKKKKEKREKETEDTLQNLRLASTIVDIQQCTSLQNEMLKVTNSVKHFKGSYLQSNK